MKKIRFMDFIHFFNSLTTDKWRQMKIPRKGKQNDEQRFHVQTGSFSILVIYHPIPGNSFYVLKLVFK